MECGVYELAVIGRERTVEAHEVARGKCLFERNLGYVSGQGFLRLELTWLRDHPQKYDLGECEFHLALRAEDFEAAHKKHEVEVKDA